VVNGNASPHSFLFADLAGFTALTEAMGDIDAADLAGQFYGEVRNLAAAHKAEAVKAIGDAVMVRADDAAQAISLALCIVLDVGGRHFFPTVRVGIHTGPAVERDGDWFGSTVNIVARVSGEAGGDEVLLTEATREPAGSLNGIELRERGRHELKNAVEPLLLYEGLREGSGPRLELELDPVCRMTVDPRRAVGRLLYGEAEYVLLLARVCRSLRREARELRR